MSPSCTRGARPRARLSPSRALAGMLALAAPAAAQEQPELPTHPPHFAITNARVVTVSGPTLEDATVVVRDGVIRAVGRNIQAPADAWVLDGAGLTVYPGLIDAFGTLGHPERRGGERAAAGGSGAAPYSWGPEDRPATFTWLSAADDLEEGDDRLAKWRAAGYTSALSTLPRGLLTGQAAVVNLAGDRGREMVVKPDVAQRINLQASGFPGYPNSLMGVFAYIRQLYMDAEHYDRAWSTYERDPRGRTRPEYDRALEPLRARGAVLFPAEGRKEILRAVRTSSEIGAPVIVYGAHRAYEAADVLAGADIPALVDLDWPKPPREGDPNAEPLLETLREWEHAAASPAALHRAGAKFAFYTGGLSDPKEARKSVRRAIEAGLPPAAALRALTLSAAEILGVADRMGSIEAGKIANLVLVRGDLLDPAAKIEQVIVDGQPYPAVEPAVASAGARGRRGGEAEGGEPADSAASPAGPAPLVPITPDRGPYREDPVTLIRNATILTAANGTIEGGDILIRDGKIAAVGKGVSAPGGAHVVDATGMYVTPGIIDAHSHLATDAVNEGSVNVSAMVGIKDVIDPEDIGIYRALAGGVTTINVLHGSANPIGGKNAVLKLRWGADAPALIFEAAPEGIKFALGENTKRDRDPDRYPSTRMGVQDVIRDAFLEARAYMAEWQAYEERRRRDRNAIPPRKDLKLETLAEILRGERLVHAHSYRGDEILQLLRLADEQGFRIATLQHVLEGYKVADEIAAHGAGASTFSDWWAYKVEAYDAIPHNAALMTERGVLVSINSDSGEEIRHLNQEAAKTMKWGGLSEPDALRLVTLNPAKQLGIDSRTGSIEVGKDADLALFRGHPLSMEGVVQQTYVDGKLYFDIRLDAERRAALEREKQALMDKHMPKKAEKSGVVTDGAAGGQEVRQ